MVALCAKLTAPSIHKLSTMTKPTTVQEARQRLAMLRNTRRERLAVRQLAEIGLNVSVSDFTTPAAKVLALLNQTTRGGTA